MAQTLKEKVAEYVSDVAIKSGLLDGTIPLEEAILYVTNVNMRVSLQSEIDATTPIPDEGTGDEGTGDGETIVSAPAPTKPVSRRRTTSSKPKNK